MKAVKENKATEDKRVVFEREFLKHARALYNFALSLVHDHDNAQDLVQEAYFRAFKYFDYYQVGSNGKSWLFMILRNTFINDYKRKQKMPVPIDFEENGYILNRPDHGAYVKLVGHYFSDEVTHAFNALPHHLKSILYLSDIEGLKSKELAEIFQIPLGTVKSRIFRARNLVKKKLLNYGVSNN